MKWIRRSIKPEDSGSDHTPDNSEAGAPNIYVGDSLKGTRKDPERLAPRNAWERLGQRILVIPRVLGSPEAAFGLRVACATMSIGIAAYLKASQSFFLKQRLVWWAQHLLPKVGSNYLQGDDHGCHWYDCHHRFRSLWFSRSSGTLSSSHSIVRRLTLLVGRYIHCYVFQSHHLVHCWRARSSGRRLTAFVPSHCTGTVLSN